MPRIIIPEFIDPGALATLKARADVHFDPTLFEDHDGLLEALPGADALIVRNGTKVRGSVLAAGSDLRVVGRLGVGLDNIDLEECRERRITVIPATGANAASVAEYVVAAMLVLSRQAFLASRRVFDGDWPRQHLIGHEIGGRTLGLLGLGSIAREVARRAKALDLRVVAHDPFVDGGDAVWQETGAANLSFDDLLAQSDFVSLHMPLTPETANLMDGKTLRQMRKGACLINTARGGIVDEAALAALLKSGHIGGAAIDVFAHEPLPAGSPLDGCPNMIATPHIAGVTEESNTRVSAFIADKVLEALGL